MPADILEQILVVKQREVAEARSRRSLAEWERAAADMPPVRDFAAALQRPQEVAIITEVKRASPSAGVIRPDVAPAEVARTYQQHGAAAVSVLTDREFFDGSLEALQQVRAAVSIPVLRKEFIIDPYQLYETRAAGADAVLLIAECLPGRQLAELHRLAVELGLHVLLEVHEPAELPRALETGARIIGINNRDLRTFVTRLEHTLELLPHIPADRLVVSESGIRTHDDLLRLQRAGVHAVLVGESLMRQPDIGAALDALRGHRPDPSPYRDGFIPANHD